MQAKEFPSTKILRSLRSRSSKIKVPDYLSKMSTESSKFLSIFMAENLKFYIPLNKVGVEDLVKGSNRLHTKGILMSEIGC